MTNFLKFSETLIGYENSFLIQDRLKKAWKSLQVPQIQTNISKKTTE